MAEIKVSPAELRTLASKCKTEGTSIQNVKNSVARAIRGTTWSSPAATRFKSDWDSKHAKALDQLAKALEQLGTAADTMAKNYDATEKAYRGGS